MLFNVILASLFIGYAAFVWRLRGGAWQNINVFIGTNLTRLVTGALLAAPVAFVVGHWSLFPLLTMAITLGLMVAGWGSYMGMGVHSRINKMQWSDYPAIWLKLKPESVSWDCLGMAVVIMPMFTLIALSFGIVSLTMLMAVVALVGVVLFTFSYWAISRIPETRLPTLLSITDNGSVLPPVHNAWAELVSGGVVGLTLLTLASIV